MLPHFFEIAEGRLELFQEGAGATKSCSLKLLRAVKRVGVLEETHIVVCDAVNDGLGFVAMAKGQLVMVTIIEYIHQIGVEWVYIVQFWEAINNPCQFLIDRLLHELNLTHVELANALNFEALADLRWCLALCLRQHDVDEVIGFWDLNDLLEIVCTCYHRYQSSICDRTFLLKVFINILTLQNKQLNYF